jgi:hypothetical protein
MQNVAVVLGDAADILCFFLARPRHRFTSCRMNAGRFTSCCILRHLTLQQLPQNRISKKKKSYRKTAILIQT